MKTSDILICVSFIAGAASGIIGTYIFLNKRFKKRLDTEYESYKKDREEMLAKHMEEMKNALHEMKSNAEKTKETIKEFSEIITGTTDISKDDPHVIRDEEFGNNNEYEAMCIVLYTDGILADDRDQPIDDYSKIISDEDLDDFIKSYDTVICTRCEETKREFEITKDHVTFEDYISGNDFLPDDMGGYD